jgi:hypothetical protein
MYTYNMTPANEWNMMNPQRASSIPWYQNYQWASPFQEASNNLLGNIYDHYNGMFDNGYGGGNQNQIDSGYYSQQAQKFTNAWLDELGNAKDIYGQAGQDISKVSDVANKLGAEYNQFQTTFSPLRDDLISGAGTRLQQQGILADQLMGLTKADYAGVRGQAAGDVAQQTQIGLDANERWMTRMGMNPSSSNWMNMRNQARLDEAKNKALASNVATNNEKNRVSDLTVKGISILDPTQLSNAALGIQTGANNLLLGQANAAGTAAQLRSGLAGSYSQNIANPLGETGGAYEGLKLGADMTNTQYGNQNDSMWQSILGASMGQAIGQNYNPTFRGITGFLGGGSSGFLRL